VTLNSDDRHSRESGNPLDFDWRKMDPRVRGDDEPTARERGTEHIGAIESKRNVVV
jgi:hypothetical protein